MKLSATFTKIPNCYDSQHHLPPIPKAINLRSTNRIYHYSNNQNFIALMLNQTEIFTLNMNLYSYVLDFDLKSVQTLKRLIKLERHGKKTVLSSRVSKKWISERLKTDLEKLQIPSIKDLSLYPATISLLERNWSDLSETEFEKATLLDLGMIGIEKLSKIRGMGKFRLNEIETELKDFKLL